MRRPGRAAAVGLAAFAAGAAHTAGFAPTGWWPLQLAALAALAWMVHAARPAAAVALGWLFGLGWFVTGVSWVFVSMNRYGGMPAPLAAIATAAFAAYLGLFPAAACGLVASLRHRAARPLGPTALAAAFASAWTLAEIARGWLLTGFPWLATGYAHTDSPLAGFAPLAGVYGVSWAAAFVAAAVAQALPAGAGWVATATVRPAAPAATRLPASPLPASRRVVSRPTALALGCAALLTVAGGLAARIQWAQPAGEPLRVRLLQGNVPQELKFDPARLHATMHRYAALLEAAPAQLAVLPETAWTVPWRMTPPDVAQRFARWSREHGAPVAIGMPLDVERGPERIANGVALIAATAPDASLGAPPRNASANATAPDASANATAPDVSANATARGVDPVAGAAIVGRYDKRHLVPFGEFVPWGFRWFVDLMHIPLGDFGRGAPDQAPLAVADQRVAFNICYEDLFGEELIGAVAAGATVLANVSNIAWFGDSLALPQHLQIARMRSLETARPMLRATNTGITAAIDARGQVSARLAPYMVGAVDAQVQGTRGLTPYVRAGNWPALAGSLGLLAVAMLGARRRRR